MTASELDYEPNVKGRPMRGVKCRQDAIDILQPAGEWVHDLQVVSQPVQFLAERVGDEDEFCQVWFVARAASPRPPRSEPRS